MRVCYVCLAPDAECRLFSMKSHCLLESYEWLSGANSLFSEDALICSQCATLLMKCVNLRDMCLSSYNLLLQCTQEDETIISDERFKTKFSSNLMPAIRETLFYQEIKENENNKLVQDFTKSCIFHKVTVNIPEAKTTDVKTILKDEIKSEKYSCWDDVFSESDYSISANEDEELIVENKEEVKCEFDDKKQSKSEVDILQTKLESETPLQSNLEYVKQKAESQQGNVISKAKRKSLTKSEILKSHYLQFKRLGDSQKKSPFLNLLAKLGNSNNKLSKSDNFQSNTQPSNKPLKLKQNVTVKSDSLVKMQSKSKTQLNENCILKSNETSLKEDKMNLGEDIKLANFNLYNFDPEVNVETKKSNIAKKYSKNDLVQKPKIYMCEQCGHIAITKKYLKEHYKTHVIENIFRCNMCDNIYEKKILLIHHIRRDHSEKTSFLCQYCSYLADNRGNLRSHERKHTGEKPFKCNVCNKCFGHKGTLDRHSLIHTGERPFKCSVCVQAFRQKICLVNHMRTHTGERPFKCHMCTMAFSLSKNLKNHINTHTGMKPYTCTICDRSFAEKSTLSKHIRTHKGIAPQQLVVP